MDWGGCTVVPAVVGVTTDEFCATVVGVLDNNLAGGLLDRPEVVTVVWGCVDFTCCI